MVQSVSCLCIVKIYYICIITLLYTLQFILMLQKQLGQTWTSLSEFMLAFIRWLFMPGNYILFYNALTYLDEVVCCDHWSVLADQVSPASSVDRCYSSSFEELWCVVSEHLELTGLATWYLKFFQKNCFWKTSGPGTASGAMSTFVVMISTSLMLIVASWWMEFCASTRSLFALFTLCCPWCAEDTFILSLWNVYHSLPIAC